MVNDAELDEMVDKDGKAARRMAWQKMPWWQKWLFASWKDAAFIIIVLFLAWAYSHDHDALMVVYEDPCAFCSCGDKGLWGEDNWTKDYGISMRGTLSLPKGNGTLLLVTPI